jgi:hypothetical protein
MFFAAGHDQNRIALIALLVGIPAFYEYTLAGMTEIRTDREYE